MRQVDLSANPRIGRNAQLLRRISRMSEPAEVQKLFAAMLSDDEGLHGFLSLSVRGLEPGQYKITRRNLDGNLGVVTVNPWRDWAQIPTHTGGFLGSLIETPEPKLLVDLDVRDDPVLGDALARFRSCFAIPLYDNGEAINWSIPFRMEGAPFSIADAEQILLRGNVIGRMTKTLVVAKEVKALNQRLTEQLEQIAQIQRSLLPDQLPSVPGLKLATSYLTSNEAGGDYYDFLEMGKGRWGMIVADVSGHGAGAATVMAMLQTILHGYQERSRGPEAMLEHANRELLAKNFPSSFVTAFFGVFDPATRRLTYSNAGHNRPQMRSPAGAVRSLDGAASLPLGIIDRPEYQSESVGFVPGETLVMYTDGITEAMSPPPEREMFGLDRLATALRECSGEPTCVIDKIHMGLYEHTRSRDRADDQTIVAAQVAEG